MAFSVGVGLVAFDVREVTPVAVWVSPPAALPPPPLLPLPQGGTGESFAPTRLPQYEEALPEGLVPSAPPPLSPVPPERRLIAIIIDDVGPDARRTWDAIALPAPVTLAFLPHADSVAQLAHTAVAAGHDVLLHMPMEPEDTGHHDPGADALTVGLAPDELRARVRRALERVPGAVGLNNHMGSRFTTDGVGMALLLAELKQRDLLFLDSRTTAQSVGPEVARRSGVRFAGRDVFLDNTRTLAAIRQQLAETEQLARRRGQAVAIGHPYPETLTVLRDWIPEARARGFDLVPVSRVARRPAGSR